MQEDALISRSNNMMETHFNDELIALNMETSRFHMFNTVAQRIWEIAKTPVTLQQLCDDLCAEFQVDRVTCEKDVAELIDYLVNERVIVVSNS
ncbi:PqqD family protein [Sphingomonas sp. MMS24-J45]|uniref:PqqD family protein n=1 Tax=Sphingomonas sp. MMS24-J45 TaxID=3238806 RepID=UPI00384AF3E6